ncbi:MAG: C10 family peptidase [Prevotella sp.]
MKRLSVLLLLSVLALQIGYAAPRSYKQAKEIALQKAASLGINNSNASIGKYLPSGTVDTDGKAYYLFDNGDNNGFVIVSGDDRLPEIIGYSTTGTLSEINMPIQLKSLLDDFEKQYDAIVGDDAKMESVTAERRALAASGVNVAPLLGSITWNQMTPYNNMCPMISGNNALTGCVATAMAQVIAYHQYPTQLQADIPSYTGNGLTLPSITASSTTYDYTKMLDTYPSGLYTEEQAAAVATLMYHCGCAVQMNYGTSMSSAITGSASLVLGKYFGYDQQTLSFVYRNEYSLSEWCQIIDHELTNSRPIIYSGRSQEEGGHAFVCDGADGNGFYHINWGWGGYCNGYFDITLLKSNEPQSTNGADGFNSYMGMVIGIKPSTVSGTAPIAQAKDLYATVNSTSLTTASRSNSDATFSGTSNNTIYNFSYKNFNGWVALAVKEGSSYKLISIKKYVSFNAMTIPGNYQYRAISMAFEYNFPVGTTKVYAVCGVGEGEAEECGCNEGIPYFYVTATETTAQITTGYSLSATLTSESTIYSGISNDLNLTVTNSGMGDYYENVNIYISNTSEKPYSASSTMLLTVPANNGSTQRSVTVKPTEVGSIYFWIDDIDGNALITAQRFTVETLSDPILTLVSVESNAQTDRYEMQDAYIKDNETNYYVKAPKTYDDAATFTFKVENTGGTTECRWLMLCFGQDGLGNTKQLVETRRIEAGETAIFTITATPEEIGSRFIGGEIFIETGTNYFDFPTYSASLGELRLDIENSQGYVFAYNKNCSVVYIADTTPIDTYTDNNTTYWTTYSNQSSDVELGVPTGRELTLYNVTVNNGEMTLTPRDGEYAYKVAQGEAVLVKTDGSTVKVDEIGSGNGLIQQTSNSLVATPAEAKTIGAGSGHVFYQLTYDNMQNKTNLGFYTAVASVAGVQYTDGSYINATPGNGYLDITKTAATAISDSAPAKGFVLGDSTNITAIEDITISDNDKGEDNANDRIFNLQGQQVKNPGKGLYIKSKKKIIVK